MRLVTDICVIGGGIAGLTVARALAREGLRVAVLERDVVGEGTGRVAAGMLAPLAEARLEEHDVVNFGYDALRFYPAFVAELERETGRGLDYRTEGTLVVGVDRDQTEQLRHGFEEQQRLGLPVEWWSGYECRRAEPCLAPGIPGGIFSRLDHQIDNRLLLDALRSWCEADERVTLLAHAGDGLLAAGAYQAEAVNVEAATFVIATGARTELLRSVAPSLAAALRPVKGQIMRLDQSGLPLVEHVVRTPEVYLAPKSDGTLVVGASSEERGFDPSITAGEIFELLRAARECVPGTAELPLVETRAGFRPAAIDNAPMIGSTGVDRVLVAMGYYRHGILFSPYAAWLLAEWLVHGRRSSWLDTFSPERFHEAHAERSPA